MALGLAWGSNDPLPGDAEAGGAVNGFAGVQGGGKPMGCEDREVWGAVGAVLHNGFLGWGKPAGSKSSGRRYLQTGLARKERGSRVSIKGAERRVLGSGGGRGCKGAGSALGVGPRSPAKGDPPPRSQ